MILVNYFDNDIIILRNIHYLWMTSVRSDEANCATKENLLSLYKTRSPKFFDKVGWLVFLNRGRPKKVSKLFTVNDELALKWEQWDVADSLIDVREKQLPVVLFSAINIHSLSGGVYSQIKEYNVIGFDVCMYCYGTWTEDIKDFLLLVLRSKDPAAFIKINRDFALRNFTDEKRQALRTELETNQKMIDFWRCKFEFMDHIEIKD